MRAVRRKAALAALGLSLLFGMLESTSPTVAGWNDQEYAQGTLTAGVVLPAVNLQCTAGNLAPVVFSWVNPTGGVTRSAYAWTLTGATNSSGTLGPTVTTISFSGLLSIGTSQFSLRAVGPVGSNWTSTAVTGTATAISIVLTSCSVP